MRVIETNLGAEVRAVAVSPDGRFVAAAGQRATEVFGWGTGEAIPGTRGPGAKAGTAEQIAFGPSSEWTAQVYRDRLCVEPVLAPALGTPDTPHRFSGAVAVSPDGKALVATTNQESGEKLLRWSLPGLRPTSGFDYWPPFQKLAFSPNGEFLAGIWEYGFEVRFAASGGLDYRHRMPRNAQHFGPTGFVSFSRDSGTCAFGWADEFHVLDTATGTSRPVRRVEANFTDAAFLPGQDRFATVGDDGRLKLWNPETWTVVREYDWGCGPLTCVAFTADGSAGVCGTADGKLVQFDVDE